MSSSNSQIQGKKITKLNKSLQYKTQKSLSFVDDCEGNQKTKFGIINSRKDDYHKKHSKSHSDSHKQNFSNRTLKRNSFKQKQSFDKKNSEGFKKEKINFQVYEDADNKISNLINKNKKRKRENKTWEDKTDRQSTGKLNEPEEVGAVQPSQFESFGLEGFENNKKKHKSDGLRHHENLKHLSLPKDLLNSKCYQSLIGGRFRYLNEKFYRSTGEQIMNGMKREPDLFFQYHRVYKEQVKQWKRSPTDLIIEWIKRRIPETAVIADLGCGEASVAKTFPNRKILSFDVVSVDPKLVTVANIAELPLENDSVDVCLLCLSLMGIDWPSYIEEAHRVLRGGLGQ